MITFKIDDRRFKKYVMSVSRRSKNGTKFFAQELVNEIRRIYKAEAYDTGALANSVDFFPGEVTATVTIGDSNTIRPAGPSADYELNYAFPVEYGVRSGIGKKYIDPRTGKWKTVVSREGVNAIERAQRPAREKLVRRLFKQ